VSNKPEEPSPGRISYGVYLWHWPFALWLLPEDGFFSPLRALGVVALSVGAAAGSFYLVERRVQGRVVAGWLTARRLIWVLPVFLVVGIGTTSAALQDPVLAPGSVRQRVLVVGDSVPLRLFPAFDEAALPLGWQAESGAKGSCSTLGLTITDSKGALLVPKIDCEGLIPSLQAQSVTGSAHERPRPRP
jgi:hypothetical protein